jgi:hypothetical protein
MSRSACVSGRPRDYAYPLGDSKVVVRLVTEMFGLTRDVFLMISTNWVRVASLFLAWNGVVIAGAVRGADKPNIVFIMPEGVEGQLGSMAPPSSCLNR